MPAIRRLEGEQVAQQVEAAVQEIALDKITVHELNPRKNPGDVTELAASIVEHGVIQPVMLVRNNGHFELVHGSRRFAAAKLAGRETIPAIVRDIAEDAIAEIALIENLQREDLGVLEIAEGYKAYLAKVSGSTIASLAQRVGKKPSTVSNTLRMLKAPPKIKDALRDGELTAAHVKVLLSLADPSLLDQIDTYGDVRVDELQVQVDELNREFRLTGPEAAVVAKAFLEEARAKFPNATITWRTDEGAIVDLVKLLGKPEKPVISRAVLEVAKLHDKLCGCQAYEVISREGRTARGRGQIDELKFELIRTCVDPKGARKVDESRSKSATAASSRSTSSMPKPRTISPAQRERDRVKQQQRREKEATAAADRVLSGTSRYEHQNVKIDPKLVKGKLDGELARLTLFAIAAINSSEWAEGWRPRLWQKIAKLKIADVRKRTAEWVARAALREIGSRQDEKLELSQLVLGHFGIEVKAPAKAKKKARR